MSDFLSSYRYKEILVKNNEVLLPLLLLIVQPLRVHRAIVKPSQLYCDFLKKDKEFQVETILSTVKLLFHQQNHRYLHQPF